MRSTFVTVDNRDVKWKSVTVARSLDAFLGSAAVVLALDGALPLVGSELRIQHLRAAGTPETLLHGYVDAFGGSGSALGGEVTLEGRDRTADLVDGTRIGVDWGFLPPVTLLDVARTIAAAWGFAVVDEANAATLSVPYLRSQPGETAYEVLERAARLHGVLLSTTADGKIRLGHPTRTRASVELRTGLGANIVRWTLRNDGTQRFRRTQIISPGILWELSQGQAARPQGIAEDAGARAERETVIVASGELYGAELDAVANWTASVARARSSTLTVEVPSVRTSKLGPLWAPGMVVPVDIPEAGISGELLVVAVELSWGEDGDRATLGLASPAAYEIDPTEAARQSRGSVEALGL